MAHAHLFAAGDQTTTHGPPFKAVLHRLSAERAFEGIEATDEERRALREWLDAENARLDDRSQRTRHARRRHRPRARGTRARSRRPTTRAWKPPTWRGRDGLRRADAQALDLRRQSFNQRVTEANRRLEDGRQALAHFNAEVKRYNLMLVYPDGYDEAPRVEPRPGQARGRVLTATT